MTIYYFDDGQLDFDFYSTEPPVFDITVRPREGYMGAFAEASFREGHDDAHLWSVTAWGETEEDALEKLLVELRQRYTVKLNRVVVEIDEDGGGPFARVVRAAWPDEVVVVVIDRYYMDDNMDTYEPQVFGPNGHPIKQLNCVEEL
jgi:hypothetical protein